MCNQFLIRSQFNCWEWFYVILASYVYPIYKIYMSSVILESSKSYFT